MLDPNVTVSHAFAPDKGSRNLSKTAEAALPPSALVLRNNRLSAHVPHALQSMVNISVLDGNLFGCLLDGSDLPSSDGGKDTYQCGSSSFNISAYIFMSALFLVVATSAAAYVFRARVQEYIQVLSLLRESG